MTTDNTIPQHEHSHSLFCFYPEQKWQHKPYQSLVWTQPPPYSDHGGLLYSCFDDIWDNWCILDYSLILQGATSKGSSTIINTPFLCNFLTDKLMIGDKHLVEYSDHAGGLLYSCYDDVWDNWCILDYSLILWGATSKGSSTIINTPFLCNYHTDKLMIGDKHSVEYSDHGGLLYSCFDDLWVNKDHQIDFLYVHRTVSLSTTQ